MQNLRQIVAAANAAHGSHAEAPDLHHGLQMLMTSVVQPALLAERSLAGAMPAGWASVAMHPLLPAVAVGQLQAEHWLIRAGQMVAAAAPYPLADCQSLA